MERQSEKLNSKKNLLGHPYTSRRDAVWRYIKHSDTTWEVICGINELPVSDMLVVWKDLRVEESTK